MRRVHAAFEDPTRFATAGHQRRLERTFTEVTPGRWRGRWDLENDCVTFEVRPALPSNVWLPPVHPSSTEDLLRNYRQVQIPYAVDEDAEEIVWRPGGWDSQRVVVERDQGWSRVARRNRSRC